jgi:hypothetical protein
MKPDDVGDARLQLRPGKAIVSTPYWHAKGCWVTGANSRSLWDSDAIGAEIASLLTNDARRLPCVMRLRGKPVDDLGTNGQALFRDRSTRKLPDLEAAFSRSSVSDQEHSIPEMQIGHFLSLCDSTGMLNTPSIAWPIALMATASTIMLVRCCWRTRL